MQPELFFHGEVLNVFNQFQLCGCGDTVFNNGGVTDLTTIGQSVRTPCARPAVQSLTRRSPSKGPTGISSTRTAFGTPD